MAALVIASPDAGDELVDTLRELLALHHIDVELAADEAEAQGIPQRKEARAVARAESEAREAAAREALQTAEHDHRQAEAALQDAEALVTRLEGQQNQVKTNEAYTTLLREIDGAKAAISRHETRILELMDETESCSGALLRTEAEEREERTALDQELVSLDEREKVLAKEIARLREARLQAEKPVDPAWLTHYERILRRRQPAVAVTAQELCLSCRVRVPPQRFMETLAGESLVTCEGCHRILIHERFVS